MTKFADGPGWLGQDQQSNLHRILGEIRAATFSQSNNMVDCEVLIEASATSRESQDLVLTACLFQPLEVMDAIQKVS
jgi:hypothetical protein